MSEEMRRPPSERLVTDYAWASWPLWNIDPPVYTVYLSNVLDFPQVLTCLLVQKYLLTGTKVQKLTPQELLQRYSAEAVAVSGNYLEVTYGRYFATHSTDGCRGAECVRQLDVPDTSVVKLRAKVLTLLALLVQKYKY